MPEYFSYRPKLNCLRHPWICGFFMQNRDFWIRFASLHGSQTSLMFFFAFKTATLAPELQVSMDPSPQLWFCAFTTASLWPELIVFMGPKPHLSFCACKTAWLAPELLVSMGFRLHLSFCAFKTTWLASELLVSMGPSPDLLFLHAKERLFDQNYKSLWVPDFACWFVHEKQRE